MAIRLTAPPRLIPDLAAAVNYLWELYNAIKTQFVGPFDTVSDLGPLSQTISSTPTKAEVEAIQDKVNKIIAAFKED